MSQIKMIDSVLDSALAEKQTQRQIDIGLVALGDLMCIAGVVFGGMGLLGISPVPQWASLGLILAGGTSMLIPFFRRR